MSVKQSIKRYFLQHHPDWLAAYDFYLKPGLKSSWGGPFNGQQGRQQIFHQVMRSAPFEALVETGTYHGTTTEFMARTSGLMVYTVEAEPRFYHYARLRLQGFSSIYLEMGDSRAFLRKLSADPAFPKRNVFFYLDAHWQEDLPLKREIELISNCWQNIAVMIDDFQVPGDEGYEYDDYGSGKRICLEYLQPLSAFKLKAYFPALSSQQETGTKRGCVVLADQGMQKWLDECITLKSYA